MAYERDDKITIEINHCLAYRKFAKLVGKFHYPCRLEIFYTIFMVQFISFNQIVGARF